MVSAFGHAVVILEREHPRLQQRAVVPHVVDLWRRDSINFVPPTDPTPVQNEEGGAPETSRRTAYESALGSGTKGHKLRTFEGISRDHLSTIRMTRSSSSSSHAALPTTEEQMPRMHM
jgi:hypothetical protein